MKDKGEANCEWPSICRNLQTLQHATMLAMYDSGFLCRCLFFHSNPLVNQCSLSTAHTFRSSLGLQSTCSLYSESPDPASLKSPLRASYCCKLTCSERRTHFDITLDASSIASYSCDRTNTSRSLLADIPIVDPVLRRTLSHHVLLPHLITKIPILVARV